MVVHESREERLERLIKKYYETLVAVNVCPEMILSSGQTSEAARLMQEMYEAQSRMLGAVGINYHGGRSSGLRDES
jgi:hypothetical protein